MSKFVCNFAPYSGRFLRHFSWQFSPNFSRQFSQHLSRQFHNLNDYILNALSQVFCRSNCRYVLMPDGTVFGSTSVDAYSNRFGNHWNWDIQRIVQIFVCALNLVLPKIVLHVSCCSAFCLNGSYFTDSVNWKLPSHVNVGHCLRGANDEMFKSDMSFCQFNF